MLLTIHYGSVLIKFLTFSVVESKNLSTEQYIVEYINHMLSVILAVPVSFFNFNCNLKGF